MRLRIYTKQNMTATFQQNPPIITDIVTPCRLAWLSIIYTERLLNDVTSLVQRIMVNRHNQSHIKYVINLCG